MTEKGSLKDRGKTGNTVVILEKDDKMIAKKVAKNSGRSLKD
jgi:hypothetical protein